MTKVLFLLKRREDYNQKLYSHIGLSTGLLNSASFVNTMLNDIGIESNIEICVDNNCIDKFVTKHRPDYAIVEALWVVPTKFNILQKLHPNVTWIVRLHSETPFMSGEGIAYNWIAEYSRFKNIKIGINAPRMMNEIKIYLKTLHNWTDEQVADKLIYLPNFYPQEYKNTRTIDYEKETVDIGCFGAVRLLKNHMLQAIAAVDFANKIGKKLNFHINAGRIEMQGQPVLHNLISFFGQLAEQGHHLINHTWVPREEFLGVCSNMDLGMQCNFSETFNIVGADLISQGVPLIGTTEIPWLVLGTANCTHQKDITQRLLLAYKYPWFNVNVNQWSLTKYTDKTVRIWTEYFKG